MGFSQSITLTTCICFCSLHHLSLKLLTWLLYLNSLHLSCFGHPKSVICTSSNIPVLLPLPPLCHPDTLGGGDSLLGGPLLSHSSSGGQVLPSPMSSTPAQSLEQFMPAPPPSAQLQPGKTDAPDRVVMGCKGTDYTFNSAQCIRTS